MEWDCKSTRNIWDCVLNSYWWAQGNLICHYLSRITGYTDHNGQPMQKYMRIYYTNCMTLCATCHICLYVLPYLRHFLLCYIPSTCILYTLLLCDIMFSQNNLILTDFNLAIEGHTAKLPNLISCKFFFGYTVYLFYNCRLCLPITDQQNNNY